MTHTLRHLSLSQGEVHFLGPPLEVGPLPTLVYFTMSHRDSLLQNPYNQVLIPLYGAPVRIFSWDLPFHPIGTDPNHGIHAWKIAHDTGEDFISPFIDSSISHLNDLEAMGALIKGQVITSGLSRGAFAAFHLAASSDLVNGVLAFAPLVKFFDLHLQEKIPALSAKWIKGFVSFHDERIHTDVVLDFFKELTADAKRQRVKQPQIELSLYPSIGYKGHGTPEDIFLAGGEAVLKLLLR